VTKPLAIAEVSEAGLIQPRENARSRYLIGDAAEPSLEPWRSSKDKHEILYPYGYELSKGNAPGHLSRNRGLRHANVGKGRTW
jgi:hypothetical protein